MPRFMPLLMLFLATASASAEWPQWRGQNRDGVWNEKALPEKFPADGLKPRWSQPIGGGYAGIAVTGGRVYALDRQGKEERILCLDATTGKTLWSHAYEADYRKMEYGNGPRSTPTVHDSRVYVFGAVGHLHCLDAKEGKVLWSIDTVKDLKGRVPTWGHACSPLIDGDRLIVQIGAEPEACIVALDRKTGKTIWQSLPDRPGYSSPVLIDAKGGRQLICWTAEHLAGLDPATGKVRWKTPHTTNYDVTISDPVWHGGVLLMSDYWEGSKAFQLDDQGENPKVIWQGKRLSLLMSTPLWRDGHIYALDRKDGLKCIELKTGKVKWEGEHVTPAGRNPQATLVWCGGDRALIFNTPGELILAELTTKGYRQISKAKILKNDTWANPAYAERCIFARNDKEIVCVPLGD